MTFFQYLVTVTAKARKITVKGPKGEIKKDLSHLPIDIRVMKQATGKSSKKQLGVRVQMWNAGYKQACAVFTFKSIISNCIIGVTEVSKQLQKAGKALKHVQKCFGVSFWNQINFCHYYIFNYNLKQKFTFSIKFPMLI